MALSQVRPERCADQRCRRLIANRMTKRCGQHDDGDRGRVGVTEFLQADDDEERRDLGDVGQIAGDEDDRAVFPDRAGEGEREPCHQGGKHHRKDDAGDDLPAGRAETRRHLLELDLEILQHRLHGPHHERQADEHQGDENAERRERDLHAERREQRADPAVLGEERGQRDAGDRGRQCERDVDDGVEDAPPRERVTHQGPRHHGTEHEIDRRRHERQAEAQPQRVEDAAAGHDGEELGEAEFGALEEQSAQRDQDEDGQPAQGDAEREAEARNHASVTFRPAAEHWWSDVATWSMTRSR